MDIKIDKVVKTGSALRIQPVNFELTNIVDLNLFCHLMSGEGWNNLVGAHFADPDDHSSWHITSLLFTR